MGRSQRWRLGIGAGKGRRNCRCRGAVCSGMRLWRSCPPTYVLCQSPGRGLQTRWVPFCFPVSAPGPHTHVPPFGELGRGGSIYHWGGNKDRVAWGTLPPAPGRPLETPAYLGGVQALLTLPVSSQWEGDRGGQNEGLEVGAVAGIKFSTGSWKIQVGEI